MDKQEQLKVMAEVWKTIFTEEETFGLALMGAAITAMQGDKEANNRLSKFRFEAAKRNVNIDEV